MAFGDLKVQDLIYEDGSNNEITVVLANLVVRDGSGDLVQADSKKFIAGTGSDLQIYHDGSNSFIEQTGTGNLVIKDNTGSGGVRIFSNDFQIKNQADSEDIAKFIENGAVELYFDNSKKFETTSVGAQIEGRLVVNNSGYGALIVMNNDDSADGAYIQLFNDSSSPADNDVLGLVNFRGNDSAGNETGYASIRAISTDITDGSESADITFGTRHNNTFDERVRLTSDGNLRIPNDSGKLMLGTSNDLQIYHDGSNSKISNGTGTFSLSNASSEIQINKGTSEYMGRFITDGAVELYYDGDLHFSTTANGVKTNGDLSFRGDGDAEQILFDASDASLKFTDNKKAKFGTGDDLQIYHNGSNSYIDDSGTGNLFIRSNEVRINKYTGEYMIKAVADGSVDLYYDNSKKLETTSGGVNVTGALTINGSPLAGGVSSDAQSNTVGGTGPGDAFTSTAYSNTLFGKYAGQYITTGDNNTIIGHQGTGGISTGSKNTLIGSGVGASGSNTARVYEGNTFIGHNMAQSVTSGSYNIAIGKGAANDLTTGGNNIYMGQSSGYAAAGASYQIGIGHEALYSCTSTNQNIAIGHQAGNKNTTNDDNVFIGKTAGKGATSGCTGSKNIAIGTTALEKFSSGYSNIAVGYNALGDITTGNQNIAIGNYSMAWAVTAHSNTSVGRYAGVSCSSGNENTFMGHRAGESVSSGGNNILLGNKAGISGSPAGNVTSGSGVLCLGDNNINYFYCADTSISSSDSRDKTDVTNFTHGLSWVNKLNPVTYRWDKRTWYNEYNEDGSLKTEVTPDGSKKRARQHIGFLAQDVLAVEQADGYASKKDDMLVVNLNEDDTGYGLKYERLVPVLVNAIKELSTEVNTLKTKVAALEA